MRQTILSTAHTRLTTWQPSDADDLLTLHSDPEVMTYLGDGNVETLDQAHERLKGYLEDQDTLGWTKWRVEDPSGTMIGRAGFSPFEETRELGYTLARTHWGKGLAAELASALVAWDHEHPMTPPHPLVVFAVDDNAASRRVLEKTGFHYVSTRDHDGRPHAFYELHRLTEADAGFISP